MDVSWITPEILTTLVAGILGIVGAVVGGALGLWGSHRIERSRREEERNRVSYSVFAALIATQEFLSDLLAKETSHPAFKIRRLAAVDFYLKVFEANLGNLGTLSPAETVMLYGVYANLKTAHGRSSAIVAIADRENIGLSEKSCNEILESAEDSTEQIALLISMLAQQHGWEELTEEDLKKFGYEPPSADTDDAETK